MPHPPRAAVAVLQTGPRALALVAPRGTEAAPTDGGVMDHSTRAAADGRVSRSAGGASPPTCPGPQGVHPLGGCTSGLRELGSSHRLLPMSWECARKAIAMTAPFLRHDADSALEQACREVEGTVSRLAKIVLHASALAERMDAAAGTELRASPRHSEHVRVLRQAAEAGRQAISRTAVELRSGRPSMTTAGPTIGAQLRR